MGPTFSTILNEFWTDFLQFSAKDGGGCHTPPTPPLMCAPVSILHNYIRSNVIHGVQKTIKPKYRAYPPKAELADINFVCIMNAPQNKTPGLI